MAIAPPSKAMSPRPFKVPPTSQRGSALVPYPGLRCAYPGFVECPPRGTGAEHKRKSRRTKRLHGTPQAYLPSVAGVCFVASPDVNSWLKGAPVSRIPFCDRRPQERRTTRERPARAALLPITHEKSDLTPYPWRIQRSLVYEITNT